MKHKKRNSLLIAGVAVLLAALACGPSSEEAPSTPVPTAAEQGGGMSPTATPQPGATEAPDTGATSTPELAGPGGCTFGSGYVADVTVPDDTVFAPNTPFVKTWRIQNTGTCDWEAGTKMVYGSGDPLGGPASVDVPATAAGANVDISVNFVSAGSPGTYRSTYQVQNSDGTRFGQQFYVQIVVPEPTPAPTDTPVPTNTPAPTNTPKPGATLIPISPPVTLILWPTYRPGDSGPVVYAIQYLLRAKGYSLSVDGSFGPQTEGVVKSLQADEGLVVDGIVGPNTWEKLVYGNTITLASGNKQAVYALQYLLLHKHAYSITVDGVYGNQTNVAVQDFQESHGLTVDGVVGRNTWRALVAN